MAGELQAIYEEWPLLFWLAGSVVVYAVASNVGWLLRRWSRWQPPLSSGLEEVSLLLFSLAVPYLAVGGWPRRPLSGLLSLQDLGLVGVQGGAWPVDRWLQAAATGLAMAMAGLVALGLAWANANRHGAGNWLMFPSRPAWQVILHGLYREVHWAFYRGTLAVVVDDVYAGIFGGLALVYLEWSLNPAWRHAWRDPAQAGAPWLAAGLALLSASIFLLTRNLWICLAVHWLVDGTFWAASRRLAAERA